MTTKRKRNVETIAKEPARIYLGPNLPGGMTKSAIYRGEVPVHVTALISKYPDVDTLLVPVGDAAAVQERISQPGTIEYQAYHMLTSRKES
jgi:hypothetical protein